MKPENITNIIINQIGLDYYKQCPKGTFFTFLKHHNHHLADELTQYKTESTPQEKWNFLLTIYAKLNKPSGKLSQIIDSLFKSAFNITNIDKSKNTEFTVTYLKLKANQYFNESGYIQGFFTRVTSTKDAINGMFRSAALQTKKAAVDVVREVIKEAVEPAHF